MSTCETCKHWKRPQEAYPGGSFNSYELNGGFCQSDKLTEAFEKEAYKLDALTFIYQENGDFWTGPNFGCVHHQP